MSLVCDSDAAYYIDISQQLVVDNRNTQMCIECGELIHHGVEHYKIREWANNEHGYEVDLAQHRCCEQCGDLALSILAMGYCWEYGQLRNDIKEMNDYG